MTRVMFLISLLALFVSCDAQSPIQISTTPDYKNGPIPWHQTVTIHCNWTPSRFRPGEAEFVADYVSIFNEESPYAEMVWYEPPDARVVFDNDPQQGVASLVIKDITIADARKFQCAVLRKGVSVNIKLDVLEPPLAGVTNLDIIASFTSATVTFDAAQGATTYSVGVRPDGGDNWDDIDTAETTYVISGLEDDTKYTARVSARNAAGVRPGIEPVEKQFFTMKKKPDNPGKYKLFSTLAKWDEAKKHCESIGLEFAMVNSADDNKELFSAAQAALGTDLHEKRFSNFNWIWIGVMEQMDENNEGTGVWTHYDGSELKYSPDWDYKNQPDNWIRRRGEQSVVAFSRKDGKWDDSFRYKKRPFACQSSKSLPRTL